MASTEVGQPLPHFQQCHYCQAVRPPTSVSFINPGSSHPNRGAWCPADTRVDGDGTQWPLGSKMQRSAAKPSASAHSRPKTRDGPRVSADSRSVISSSPAATNPNPRDNTLSIPDRPGSVAGSGACLAALSWG